MQHVSRGLNSLLRDLAGDRVPYERLEAAQRNARECFPDAKRIVAVWTPANESEIAVEVWYDVHEPGRRVRQRADVYPANALS
jgi:hypothetical protein